MSKTPPPGYPAEFKLSVLRKVAVTPCVNPGHHQAVEFHNPEIVPGYNTIILCADCCVEEQRRQTN